MCTCMYTRVYTHIYATVCKWKSGQLALLAAVGSQGSDSGCLVGGKHPQPSCWCQVVWFGLVSSGRDAHPSCGITPHPLLPPPQEELGGGGGLALSPCLSL